MKTKNFETWSIELEKVWNLETEEESIKFSDLMYLLKGDEDVSVWIMNDLTMMSWSPKE
ncbi:hypothetical protein [Sphingobacterium sp. GVS05A]|uniref:hypothetical protein n=1 Tax=Sphingobacterium TaxID=28453 RepID=UPI001CBCDCF8|nr:hypothetical protein [Sphingobacterium sp. GVS05A]